MQSNDFFINHLYNKIQDYYGLSDDEITRLINFVEEMYDHDKIRGVKIFIKNRGDKNLERMMQEVLGRRISALSVEDNPINNTGPLSMPMGVPLAA